jgi:hypothetical protein
MASRTGITLLPGSVREYSQEDDVRSRFFRGIESSKPVCALGDLGKDGEHQGLPSKELIALYRNLAKGGVGLIMTGAAVVNEKGTRYTGMCGIHD